VRVVDVDNDVPMVFWDLVASFGNYQLERLVSSGRDCQNWQ